MYLLVSLPYLIRLMHGHGLFKKKKREICKNYEAKNSLGKAVWT
jgi:hypothetical protein